MSRKKQKAAAEALGGCFFCILMRLSGKIGREMEKHKTVKQRKWKMPKNNWKIRKKMENKGNSALMGRKPFPGLENKTAAVRASL